MNVLLHLLPFLCLAFIGRSDLVATKEAAIVRISGFVSLLNSSHGTSVVNQSFSGSVGQGWHWKETAVVSVRATNVGWEYTATRSGQLQTSSEESLLIGSSDKYDSCWDIFSTCFCNPHVDYGAEQRISIALVEKYFTHTMSVTSSAWSVEVSITSPSNQHSATLSPAENTSTSSEFNASSALNTSSECFRDLSSSHSMLALETNLSAVYFLESRFVGNTHNTIGYTGETWASDMNCSVRASELLFVPENGTTAVYTEPAFDLTAMKADPMMYLFKTGVLPTGLMQAVVNSSNVEANNAGNCQIVSDMTTDANVAQKWFVSGANGGVVDLSIEIPAATFLEFFTSSPSMSPTTGPSQTPTSTPSTNPTTSPSQHPSEKPSSTPSSTPTTFPTLLPSQNPSGAPSQNPSKYPSLSPTHEPTSPTVSPTKRPTAGPSTSPTSVNPTTSPTNNPSTSPTLKPTAEPTPAPVPTASFTAETFGVLFINDISEEALLNNYIGTIESTIATQLSIDPSRVIVTRVSLSSRRLLTRNLQSQALRVDFTMKGYTNTIDTLKLQIEQPSVQSAIAVALRTAIPGADVFDVAAVSITCAPGEILYNNGAQVQCVSTCSVDQVLNADGSCEDVTAQTITTQQPQTSNVNYLARALYTALGLFSWGFCMLVFNVCHKMRR